MVMTPDKHYGPYRARFMRGINGTDSILETPFPQIAFVGRSNVGKSSTINALLGVSGIARTSATPGKTQEINFFMIMENMFFVDLPGYGFARMPDKEREAIRKHIVWYLSGGETHPRLVILIIDARIGLTEHDQELLSIAKEEGHPVLILMNKVDKLTQSERAHAIKAIAVDAPGVDFVPFSAKTKEGVDKVREIIFVIKRGTPA
jgi:GTP-binding protein